jgi:membrane protein required for colicin V production
VNYLDIIIGVLLAAMAIQGFRHGLIKSLASLAALILGIYGGIKLAGYAADILTAHIDLSREYLFVIGFILVFIIVVILVSLIGKLLDKVITMAALGPINKILGLFFGVAKGLIILSIIIMLYDFFDPDAKLIKQETRDESFLYKPIGTIAPILLVNIRDFNPDSPHWDNYEKKVKRTGVDQLI